ncbi:glycosyl transferase [Leptolyngbya sp. Heron Island J]|uniref:glycosyltransferase n=1 Tax=Leptolyngbya sp. Heron Island J TaxID=1385935 RepID=UPI0003B9C3C0|nr:glycosyltransferase [Leptolyngbya sp. Heron Island J]ESA33998.1 glycosyl transferase [Leptolyngbya sp. Heron Island J]
MTHSKVCITTLEFPPDVGGVGESVARIANLLKDIGYEVHVAVFHSKQRKAEGYYRSDCSTTDQNGIQVHRLTPASRSNAPILQDYRSEIYFQLKQLHRQHQFDLFHAFFINETGFITTLLAKEESIPVINSVRGSDLHKHVFSPKQHGQIGWILESSDWVTFVSGDLQRRGQVLVPALKEKSSAFWNSIQPVDFSDLPTPPLADQLKGLVIGSVGRFRDKKGLEYLLAACAELKQTIPLTLLLVGDFAERERPYWEAAIRDLAMADHIVLTGMVPRTEGMAYLHYMDIYTIPSLHDGCPNALLEAMLASRPIIGTRVDAIGEILAHNYNGLVVPPGSTAALKAAILTLAQSPELRQRLGQAALSTVQHHLSPSIEQRNWARVYNQVLTRSLSVLAS